MKKLAGLLVLFRFAVMRKALANELWFPFGSIYAFRVSSLFTDAASA